MNTENPKLQPVDFEGFVVNNRPRNPLKLIPYIGCKAGFSEIFDKIIPDHFEGQLYDIFGGGGSFSFYASSRFGSHRVNYNDNNPVIVNLIRQVQVNPKDVWSVYNEHFQNSSDDYYYLVRQKKLKNDVESAGNFLYLAKNAFSGKIRFNSKNKFNSPIRKGSSCPKISCESLLELSSIISEMTITNLDYKEFAGVCDSLIYLDPPYFNNSNGHYNGILELNEFTDFLRAVESKNKVVLSEQNSPKTFNLPDSYTVRPVTLNRSLQYFTQTDSQEIVAFN